MARATEDSMRGALVRTRGDGTEKRRRPRRKLLLSTHRTREASEGIHRRRLNPSANNRLWTRMCI
jgi:hypothetical protein